MDDGNVYKGKFTMFAVGLKGVNLRLKTESGDKINRDNMNLIKFDAPKTKVGKLLSLANQGNKISLSETLGQDWKTALNQEYYILEEFRIKKETLIPPIINPGFDDKIQVYLDPKAKETGGSALTGGLVGGKDKSYYFQKDSFTTLVEKGSIKNPLRLYTIIVQ